MNQKLFKKLNEQVEINTIKRAELTEAEKAEVEKKLIFEGFTAETEELLRVEDNALSLEEGADFFLDSLILEEMKEYLAEELEELRNLNEEVLNEGKLWNRIRWKLAKFSLRFLKEDSINQFLMAYYADKNGKPTPKGIEWTKKTKKEKVAKLRDMADNMKEDQKQKVINSEAAKQCEQKAIRSGIFAGIAGVSGAIAAGQMDAAATAASKAENSNPRETIDGNVEINSTSDGTTSANLSGTSDIVASGTTIDNTRIPKGTDIHVGSVANATTSYNIQDIGKDAATLQNINQQSFGQNVPFNSIENGNVQNGIIKDYADELGISTELARRRLQTLNPVYTVSSNDQNGFDFYGVLPDNKNDTLITKISGSSSISGTSNGTINMTSSGSGKVSGTVSNNGAGMILSLAATLLSSLASLFLGVMWGSFIMAGVQGVKAGYNAHKANVMRREEILQQLMQAKKEENN